MKRTAFRLFTLLLVIALFASLSVPAAAAGINNQIKSGPAKSQSSPQSSSTRAMLDLASNRNKITWPESSDYFPYCTAMYADAPMGHSIKAFDHWVTNTNSLFDYIFHGSRVYVLAEHGDSYCVLYYTAKNTLKAAWVPIERLTTSYPGKTYQFGYAGVLTGSEKTSDLLGSWSKENFVNTKTKFLVLGVPAEDCVAFTLDYQLITRTGEKQDVLGPRSVYVNDGSGWTWVGDFDYSSTCPCHVEVYLDYPMDLVAVAAIANVRDPDGFTVRQSLLDVKCR